MKKSINRIPVLIFSVSLALLMVVSSVPIVFAKSDTSIPDGYIPIYTVEDLYFVRNNMKSNYILMNDIDLSEATAKNGDWDYDGRGWNPIGSGNCYSSNSFSGIFDGNGYRISGLRIDIESYPSGTQTSSVALFSSVSGTVKNLLVEGRIKVKHNVDGLLYVGGIAASVTYTGTIENCRNRVTINATNTNDNSTETYIGGITGSNTGIITKCANYANLSLTVKKTGYIGGISGLNCTYAPDTLTFYRGQISQCVNKGSLYQSGNSVKYNGITYNDINFYTYDIRRYAIVTDCYNIGNLPSSAIDCAGISSQFSSNNNNYGNISNCYNLGSISGYAISNASVTGCYYLKDSGANSAGATSLNDNQMKLQGMYPNWDFSTIWVMGNTSEYPYPMLQFEFDCAHKSSCLLNSAEATCTDTGYTGDVVCNICGQIITLGNELPSKGHTSDIMTVENVLPSTCTNKGSYDEVVYCSVCGEELSRNTVETDVVDHVPDKPVKENEKAATCTGKGSYDEVVYCTLCEEELSRNTVETDAFGHTPSNPAIENERVATCTDNGSYDEVVYCSVCREELSRVPHETERIGHASGETITENVVAATCKTKGSYDEVVYCTRCGDELSRTPREIGLLDHTPSEVVLENTVAATCKTKGSYDEVVYCTKCGDELSRTPRETGLLDHTPGEAMIENAVAATCKIKGSYDEVVYCTKCGDELSRTPRETGLLHHTPSEVVIENTVAATCKTKGSFDEVVYCTECGDELSRTTVETDMLRHVIAEPVLENSIDVSCMVAGKHDSVVYCQVCGAELSRETIIEQPLGHTDDNNDGHCDACGEQMTGGDHCKFCGKIHNGGFFDKLTGFFHKIFAIFKR